MDTESRCILLTVGIILGIFFEAVISSLEECNKVRIKQFAQDHKKRGALALIMIEKHDFARLCAVTGKAVSCACVFYAFCSAYLQSMEVIPSVLLAALTSFAVMTLFATYLSYPIVCAYADSVLVFTSFLFIPSAVVLAPLTFVSWVVSKITVLLLPNKNKDIAYTENEFSDIIEKVEEEGLLVEDESEIIQSALEFKDMTVKGVMCPITDVFSIGVNSDKNEILKKLTDSPFSRVPVYKDDPKVFFGILRAADYLLSYARGDKCDIKSFIVPAIYVSPESRLTTVMNEMRSRRLHMAIVRNKDRNVLGIVTLEDLLDEIVGEIYDKEDNN